MIKSWGIGLFSGLIILSASWAVAQNAEPIAAEIISEKPDYIAISIYNDDLALISELRTVDLPKGRSTIIFSGVSDLIIPQTALLQSFSGFTLEQNFDFNLLTKGSLLEKAVGETISLVTTNSATGEIEQRQGTILSGGQGVVIDFGGTYETLHCSAMPERIIFDQLPDGLQAKPTLSIIVNAEEAGPQEIRLAYLSSGFGWQANYRFDLSGVRRAEDNVGHLTGWLTIENRTAMFVEQADMVAIAGDLQRLWETRAQKGSAKSFYANCWQKGTTKKGIPAQIYGFQPAYDNDGYAQEKMLMMPAPMAPTARMAREAEDSIVVTASRASQEDLGDYKLFRVPWATDVAAYQTKQILFLEQDDVAYEKFHVLRYEGLWDDGGQEVTEIEYHLDNDKDGNLAKSLPEGMWRIMQAASPKLGGRPGSPFYLGEDVQDNLAVGLPVKINVGTAADVQIETRVVDEKNIETRRDTIITTKIIEHEIFNASPDPVVVKIIESEDTYTPPRLKNYTIRPERGEARPTWHVSVPANASKKLRYTIFWEE